MFSYSPFSSFFKNSLITLRAFMLKKPKGVRNLKTKCIDRIKLDSPCVHRHDICYFIILCYFNSCYFNVILLFHRIVTMIRHLERMLTSYAVPIAFIHGDRYVTKIIFIYLLTRKIRVVEVTSKKW